MTVRIFEVAPADLPHWVELQRAILRADDPRAAADTGAPRGPDPRLGARLRELRFGPAAIHEAFGLGWGTRLISMHRTTRA